MRAVLPTADGDPVDQCHSTAAAGDPRKGVLVRQVERVAHPVGEDGRPADVPHREGLFREVAGEVRATVPGPPETGAVSPRTRRRVSLQQRTARTAATPPMDGRERVRRRERGDDPLDADRPEEAGDDEEGEREPGEEPTRAAERS